MLPRVARCSSVLYCVAVYCSVLQCVAVRCYSLAVDCRSELVEFVETIT